MARPRKIWWNWPAVRSRLTVKNVSVAVGLAGSIFGAALGGLQLYRQFHEGQGVREQVRRLASVGDRFAEHGDFERAIEEYNKALAIKSDDLGLRRRVIGWMRQNLEMRNPALNQKKADAALTQLYQVQALYPRLKNDRELLLEEALILKAGGSSPAARDALEKAYRLYPADPDIAGNLGNLRAEASSGAQGVDLLRSATRARPSDAAYHYYLAGALEHSGQEAEAIRECRRAAELGAGGDFFAVRTRNYALMKLFDIFRTVDIEKGGVLSPSLPMPVPERIESLEYYLANYATKSDTPHFYLAKLYRAQGDLNRAKAEIHKALGDDKSDWHYKQAMIELFIQILDEGKMEPEKLAEARAALAGIREENAYEQILEIGPEKGHPYLLGLKAPADKSDLGVLMVRVFPHYPFADAGVREGDRIVEFAHRKTGDLRDIYLPLIEFDPGTKVPLKVRRGDRILDLILTIR